MSITLVSLAADIEAAHAAAIAAGLSALEHARRAGELLNQAKDQCAHGDWLPWLAAHCPSVPERTAQAYMRIAREWPALEGKAQRVADLPVRQALALLAEPTEPSDGTLAELSKDLQELEARSLTTHAHVRYAL